MTCVMRLSATDPLSHAPTFARPDALAACTSARVKRSTFLSATKQADGWHHSILAERSPEPLLPVHAARQQYVLVKRGHRPPLVGAQFALVHVGAYRDGTFQRIEGFLRLLLHHFSPHATASAGCGAPFFQSKAVGHRLKKRPRCRGS